MNQKNSYYDVAIIGAGPGGYVAAITAARLGKKVALIEEKQAGGTCLNVGCIPTKTLLASANLLNKINHASALGIQVKDFSFDFSQMQQRKEKVIENLRQSLTGLIKANKISLHFGKASFISSHELQISGSENFILQADKIIIATGSSPCALKAFPCEGILIHNSTSILDLKKLPKSMAIIGGGYIGCEFASFFSTLGVKVTLIESLPFLISSQDPSLIEELSQTFKNQGIKILTSTKVMEIEKNKDHVTLKLDNQKDVSADICLLAIGRKLNTQELNLQKAGLNTETNQALKVNESMQTQVEHIYAIGDVTGKWMLAHVASHEGIVAAKHACGKNALMHYEAVPSVIFTIPEIASVGLTEKEALEKGFSELIVSKYPLSFLGKAQASCETQGFVKLIADKSTNQILGAHMFGHDASIMIGEMALAINNELTLDCVADTIHAHPTLSEAWLEASLLATKNPLHHPPIK